jgi:hypothetical protein
VILSLYIINLQPLLLEPSNCVFSVGLSTQKAAQMDIFARAAQVDIMNERNIVKRWKTMVGKAVFCQQMFLIEWCLAKTYPGFRWFNYMWGLRLDMPTPTSIRKHLCKTKRLPTPDL